jgi:hypothetical protein
MANTESAIDHPLRSDEHPERHEHSDISVGPLAVVLAVGVLVVVFTLVGVYAMFWLFGEVDKRLIDAPPMTAITTPKIEPREPRIQGIPGFHTNLPWQDTEEMKKEVAVQLGGYGTTPDGNFVHIPIDQAMQQVAQDGSLKVRDNPSVPNQGGADVAP